MSAPDGLPYLATFALAAKGAVVVGAGRGIGRAIALALAGAGADVVLAGRCEADLLQVAAEVKQLGRRAWAVPADLRQPAQVERLAEAAIGALGRVDVLVHNAGLNPSRRGFEASLDEDWALVLDVNLLGAMHCLRAFGRHMLAQQGGSIVTLLSICARRGAPNLGVYSASKGALEALTRTLALEWVSRGIRVNGVAPGYVKTDLTRKVWSNPELYSEMLAHIPMGRFATPDEIAPAVVFLASDAARYITGTTIVVDGGWTAL